MSKTSPGEELFATVLGALITVVLGAWMLMIGMEAAHSVWAAVPDVGYTTALGLWVGVAGLRMAVAASSGSRK